MLEGLLLTKEERLAEQGTLAGCPLCQRPRVQRSDYIRCNPCGINWLEGEDRNHDPRIERFTKLMESLKPLRESKSQRG